MKIFLIKIITYIAIIVIAVSCNSREYTSYRAESAVLKKYPKSSFVVKQSPLDNLEFIIIDKNTGNIRIVRSSKNVPYKILIDRSVFDKKETLKLIDYGK